jgi:hypothetical protein
MSMSKLIIQFKNLSGRPQTFTFSKKTVVIGSDLNNDIVINDQKIDQTAYEIKTDGRKLFGRHPAGTFQEIKKDKNIPLGNVQFTVKQDKSLMLPIAVAAVLILFLFLIPGGEKPETPRNLDNPIEGANENAVTRQQYNPYIGMTLNELEKSYDVHMKRGLHRRQHLRTNRQNYLSAYLDFQNAFLAASAGGARMREQAKESEKNMQTLERKLIEETDQILRDAEWMNMAGSPLDEIIEELDYGLSYFASTSDNDKLSETLLEQIRKFETMKQDLK